MLFNANEFILVFLPIVVIGYYLTRAFSKNIGFGFLTLASLVFYGYGEPIFIALLLASITFNYFIGCHLIDHKSKPVLIFGIAVNVAAISFFKYANFFISNFNYVTSAQTSLIHIALPLGISFYTFQKIAFLVDAYKSQIRKPRFIEYVLFVSFFPQLIAGPITHYNQIESQLRNRETIPLRLITAGIFLYSIGLFKKSFFADFSGAWADIVFNNPVGASPEQTLLGVIAYTLEIYFDFSGYSDMAIGLGMMFGIVLPINFNSPYKSKSIVEFWRRWHITLSTWLKDYIYIPLGGRGNSSFARTFNLMITMLVGGLWHGAAWTFVVWGGLHGIGLAINHAWLKIKPSCLTEENKIISRIYNLLCWALTFLFVAWLWTLFRANSFEDAITVSSNMMHLNLMQHSLSIPSLQDYFLHDYSSFASWLISENKNFIFNLCILTGLLFITWFSPNSISLKDKFQSNLFTAIFCTITIFTVVMANIFLVTPNAFIYFRF